MNRTETAKLLTFVSTIDKRTVGESDVIAWHLILEPISFERAKSAVVSHLRHKPGVWLEPGHVWEGAKTVTDSDAADTGFIAGGTIVDCEHGTFCGACKGVHHAHEPCDVLVRASDLMPRIRALAAAKSIQVAIADQPAEVNA